MSQDKLLKGSILSRKGLSSDIDLQIINSRYARRNYAANEVFVTETVLCHNAIDRDNERFSEKILEDFARTIPGKSLLRSHSRDDFPLGLFYAAEAKSMTIEDFAKMTGVFVTLPPSVKEVVAVLAKFYLVVGEKSCDEVVHKIESGVLRYVSVGFSAAALIDRNDDGLKFKEYVAPGEATEGSLVWLGAQQGAMVKGAAGYGAAGRALAGDDNPLIPCEGGKAVDNSACLNNPLIIPQ